ncbi:MAG: hypothetical protein ACOZDD_03930 [Bacteroidota bacterium]
MKKNRLFFMFAALLVAAAVMFSCQKEEAVSLEEGLTIKGASSSECDNCVNTWAGSLATYNNFKKGTVDITNFSLTAYNDASKIYFTLKRIDGTFGTLVYNGKTLLNNVDPKVSSWSWTQTLPSGWEACYKQSIVLSLNDIPGVGNAQGSFEYFAQELCTTTTLTASETEDICVGDEVIISAAVSTKEPVSGGGFLAVTDGVLKIYKDGVEVASGVNSAEYTYIAEFGDVVFTAEYTGAGGFADSDDEITVTAENCGCEESFCYVDNGDGSYTFTYVPAESFTEAYLEFTFPGTTVDAEAEGWSNPANGVPANVKQITIDLVECVPYVFTFKLTNINGPLWTDFKVNGTARNLGYDNELSCEIE